ncbi:uncharacterized protein [Ptychodera flava]|uniref:uncharacterized protein n=1 Tax=Ptychodera flava TaxID=63121 RepID=UPI003969EC1B
MKIITISVFLVCFCVSAGRSEITGNFTCDEQCNFTRRLNESAPIGTDVFFLPIHQLADAVNVSIQSGNLNDRFSVNKSGVVYLSGLLDYDLVSKYILDIAITEDGDVVSNTVTLTVEINDEVEWPPVFNENCSFEGNDHSLNSLLYEIYVGQGEGLKPIEELLLLKDTDDVKNFVNGDTYNGRCNVILYIPSRLGHLTIRTAQNFQLHCNLELNTNISAQVLSPDDSALNGNPYINQWWFEEPQNDDMLLLVSISHTRNEVDTGKCDVYFEPFHTNILSLSIKVVPQGCPAGKYGFKCDQDCVCQNGATCHVFNGACKCLPGWTGPACDIDTNSIGITPKIARVVYGGLLVIVCNSNNIRMRDKFKDIAWYFNNSQVQDNNDLGLRVHNTEEGRSSLTTDFVTDSHTGLYACVITDIAGRNHSVTAQVIVTGCAANRWGETCEELCDCQHKAPCMRKTGCECPHGWNGTTCSQDVEKPTIKDCPKDIIVTPKKGTNITVTWKEPQITDNSRHLNITSNFHPGQQFDYGVHTVIYKAVDEGNNVATCTFTVTVIKPGQSALSLPVISVLAVLAFLVCVLCVIGPYLGYKYRHEIQTIIAEKFRPYEDDDGRSYDAFVSVKGDTDDEIFVYRTLLPTLEKQYGFKLCLHHRDFLIGEAIVENIITAIKDSRRTILVLSPAFVESEWCDYEVLMAHKEMVGLRQKLIPLMFEDIGHMTGLRPSLQAILNTITYIEWPKEGGERDMEKFWKRLVKAMPRKRSQEKPNILPGDDFTGNTSSFWNCFRRFQPNRERATRRHSVIVDEDEPLILQEDHVT